MGKGQWKGQNGGGKPSAAPAAAVKAKVLKKKITGTVTEWKGKFGWIKPNTAVDHPEASKNKGRIYMAQEDVEEDINGVGAAVSFFVYADGKGLGAKNVRNSGGGGGNGGVAKQPAAGKPWLAKSAPAQGAQNGGARQKIGGQRLTGTVQSFKGSFGWIVPSAKVNHPDAQKKGGKIYFEQKDVEQELSGIGATVSFFLYKDKTGLGAMNVRPGKAVKQQQGGGQENKVKNTKLKVKKEQVKKEKKEPKEFDKTNRTPVSADSLGGTVVITSRDTIAWIRPDVDIDHEKYNAESKKLFVHKDDIDGEFPKVGATVTFTLYEDEKGLGGEQCQVLEQGDGTLPEDLQAELNARRKANDKAKKEKKKGGDKKGKKEGKNGAAAVKVGAFAKKQAENKNKKKKNNKKKKAGDSDEKKEKGPSGPDLPRTRVTKALVTGEVLSMNKVFGWIKPSTPVEHEAATKKHGGKIYLHKNDIAEGVEITKGSTVTFHVYADASGLGAEECS